ncbi:TPA: glyoxalase [Bacillus cereus]|nr:glyoxalase [Bacillus cereus]
MNRIFEELINELNQSISENKKLADIAHEKGDMGLAGYHQGISEANKQFALKVANLMHGRNRTIH